MGSVRDRTSGGQLRIGTSGMGQVMDGLWIIRIGTSGMGLVKDRD